MNKSLITEIHEKDGNLYVNINKKEIIVAMESFPINNYCPGEKIKSCIICRSTYKGNKYSKFCLSCAVQTIKKVRGMLFNRTIKHRERTTEFIIEKVYK